MWGPILRAMQGRPPAAILEVGANIGVNLRALRLLINAELYALEPNEAARHRLAADAVVLPERILDGTAAAIPLADGAVDLVFTSGVLIHIAPEALGEALGEMYRVSRRYLLSIEYFSDRPETIRYRGEDDLLFKRDFGSAWLERFPDLRLLDYGFLWKPVTNIDNLTWWLFEKSDS
jgi:pseudaminic acid biosynthesis-associated methylase